MLIWTQTATSTLPETYCERSYRRNNVEELDTLDMTGIQKRPGICKKGHVQTKASVQQSKSDIDVRELSTASEERSVCYLCSGPQECHGAQSCAGETQSHSPSATVPQEHLSPEPDPEALFYPVRDIMLPKIRTSDF